MRTRSIASVVVVLIAGMGFLASGLGAAGGPPRYEAGKGLSEPKVVVKVAPKYPESARADGVTGEVVLDLSVDTAGAVGDVTVVKDPDQRLSQAAVDAVRQWRFEPARDGKGNPVAVVYSVTVAFKLE